MKEIRFPVSLIKRDTNEEYQVHTLDDLIAALDGSVYTTIEAAAHAKLLNDALKEANDKRFKFLKEKTICEECDTWVMEQFMDCYCGHSNQTRCNMGCCENESKK